MTLLTLSNLDPGDSEINNETFATRELGQRTTVTKTRIKLISLILAISAASDEGGMEGRC